MTIEEILTELEGRDEETQVVAEVFNERDDIVEVSITGIRFENGQIILETEHP